MSFADELGLSEGSESDQKEIVKLLLDKEHIELITELKESEILPLAILESYAKYPFGSSDINLELVLCQEMVKIFKIGRISLNRQSRKEIIEGWLGAQIKQMKEFKDRISTVFKTGM